MTAEDREFLNDLLVGIRDSQTGAGLGLVCDACSLKVAWCINTMRDLDPDGRRDFAEVTRALFPELLSAKGPDGMVDPVLLGEIRGKTITFSYYERLELLARIDQDLIDRSGVMIEPGVRCLAWNHDRDRLIPLLDPTVGRMEVFEQESFKESLDKNLDEFIEHVRSGANEAGDDRPAGVLKFFKRGSILTAESFIGPVDDLVEKLDFLSPETVQAMQAVAAGHMVIVLCHRTQDGKTIKDDMVFTEPL
jgi:hypothetical protein